VDHPRGQHDDHANAFALAAAVAMRGQRRAPAKMWTARIGDVPEIDFDFTGDHATWSRFL
jgi:hypothetical protein